MVNEGGTINLSNYDNSSWINIYKKTSHVLKKVIVMDGDMLLLVIDGLILWIQKILQVVL